MSRKFFTAIEDDSALLAETSQSDSDFTELFIEQQDMLDNAERSMVVLEQLCEMQTLLKNGNTLSDRDLSFIKIAAEMAVAGTGYSSNNLLPGLESWSSVDIATERLESTLSSSIGRYVNMIGNWIKTNDSHLQYFFTLFERQAQSLSEETYRIKKLGNKITVSASNSKYMKYGEIKQIETSSEYLSEYNKMADIVIPFIKYSKEYGEKDLFSSFKTLVSPITGYSENFWRMYKEIDKFVMRVKDLKNIKEIIKNKEYSEYSSGSLIGLSRLNITLPTIKPENIDDIKLARRVVSELNVKFFRDSKYDLSRFVSGKTTLENMDRSAFLNLHEKSLEIIDGYKSMMSFSNRLSAYGANMSKNNAMAYASNGFILPFILSNYRMLLKSSSIVLNTTADLFTYSRGNVAKLIELSKSAR